MNTIYRPHTISTIPFFSSSRCMIKEITIDRLHLRAQIWPKCNLASNPYLKGFKVSDRHTYNCGCHNPICDLKPQIMFSIWSFMKRKFQYAHKAVSRSSYVQRAPNNMALHKKLLKGGHTISCSISRLLLHPPLGGVMVTGLFCKLSLFQPILIWW